jgi:hypothetical protein
MYKLITVILNAIIVLLFTSCVSPSYDKHLNVKDKDIIKLYGAPTEIAINSSGKILTGELRHPVLENQLKENKNITVKEMYYRRFNDELIFWLEKDSQGNWVVISDVKIPQGVIF